MSGLERGSSGDMLVPVVTHCSTPAEQESSSVQTVLPYSLLTPQHSKSVSLVPRQTPNRAQPSSPFCETVAKATGSLPVPVKSAWDLLQRLTDSSDSLQRANLLLVGSLNGQAAAGSARHQPVPQTFQHAQGTTHIPAPVAAEALAMCHSGKSSAQLLSYAESSAFAMGSHAQSCVLLGKIV